MKKPKQPHQINLFGDTNTISLEEYAALSKPRAAHEKKFMTDLIGAAGAMGLPSIHINYFCGNKFFPICTGTPTHRHQPVRLICPACHQPHLVTCRNRINTALQGHFDILGISWAMETKHKINKGPQTAKPSTSQHSRALTYTSFNIPHIVINESNVPQAIQFLQDRAQHKEQIHTPKDPS